MQKNSKFLTFTHNQLLIRSFPSRVKLPTSICSVPKMHEVKIEPIHAYAALRTTYKLSSYWTIYRTNNFLLCFKTLKPSFWALQFLYLNHQKQGTVFLLHVKTQIMNTFDSLFQACMSKFLWPGTWWICKMHSSTSSSKLMTIFMKLFLLFHGHSRTKDIEDIEWVVFKQNTCWIT
jgi:hypothetical protein